MPTNAPPDTAGPSTRMYSRLKPLLFKLDAENAHHLGMGAATLGESLAPGLVERAFGFEHERLRTRVWGFDFANPVGLAAGFDKNARLLAFWRRLGFGYVEAGSVTARPSAGNPRPRAFRLPEDQALINRMGLNNDGAEAIARRLEAMQKPRDFPLGINLAKTHDPTILGDAGIEDFRASLRLLLPYADYIALNISCPNTAEGKTFEAPDVLDRLLSIILSDRSAVGSRVPILVKLSPPAVAGRIDGMVEDVVDVALSYQVDGFIATNTYSGREGLITAPAVLETMGRGGLSGAPLADRATDMVRFLYRRTGGRVPIIGVGGISSAGDAYGRIRAGASLVQLYTALVYQGPGVVKDIKRGLVRRLEQDHLATLREAVGRDA